MIPSVALLSLLVFLVEALPSQRDEISARHLPKRDGTSSSRVTTDTTSPSIVDTATNLDYSGGEAVRFLPPDALRVQYDGATSQLNESPAPQVMAYYPDWVAQSFPPERIDFTKFDWIDFAFALPDSRSRIAWDDPDAVNLLSRLVLAAHSYGKKVKLSVGGWTGSTFFSTAMASSQRRQILIQDILSLFNKYSLDGIDIDWEYPGRPGNRGNRVSPDDTANFLIFLRELRAALSPDAKITAAVPPDTFADSSGNPIQDASEFAKVLDWVLLMNYDSWGSSSQPGPNAPLADACHNSTQPEANAVSAFNAWTSAGFPPSKLVLGLPSYGYISRSSASTLRNRDVPAVVVANDDGGVDGGQVQFRALVQQGALVRADARRYVGGAGFERRWDACSGTPFLRSAVAGQVVTYDDAESLRMKAEFARGVGMRGINLFDVHGDTEDWALIDAVREGLGLHY